MGPAFGAGRITLLPATFAHFAPGRALIFMASGAPVLQITPARAAVQTAIADQANISNDLFHGFLLIMKLLTLPRGIFYFIFG